MARRPSLRQARAEAPFLSVLAVLAAAVVFLIVAPSHWLRGTGIVAVAMLLAGLLRATLSPGRAGLLVVRGRPWDVICYAGLGVLILVVGLALPG